MERDTPQRLLVQTEERQNAVVLYPDGDVDAQSYDAFRDALARATEAGRPRVVVDLANVRYIDSRGLGALVSSLRDANEIGCRICLVCSTPHLSRVLQVTGLSQLFHVYAHRDEALAEQAPEALA